MNALVCMQAKKRRLHAVPSCGSDRLKLHFREGSVADISHIRKAFAPREPWNGENRRIFQLVRDLQSLKKRQNSCYRRNLRAHAFFDMGDVSNWPLRRASKSGVLEKNQKIFHVFSFCCFFTFWHKFRSEKSPPYGRAQRLTRPKCAILGKITRHIKIFLDRFQREERNEKWGHHRRITSHEVAVSAMFFNLI